MNKYQVEITMADGSVGRHCGPYIDGLDAVTKALNNFPEATRIRVWMVV